MLTGIMLTGIMLTGIMLTGIMLTGIDNERIREILPLLRLRSPEPTLFSQRGGLKNPRRLLTSASFFERHIGDHATDLSSKSLDHRDLPRIASIRQALGFDELPVTQTLTSTRQIEKADPVGLGG